MSGKKITGIILTILGLVGAYYYIGGYIQCKNNVAIGFFDEAMSGFASMFGMSGVCDGILQQYWPMMAASVAAIILGGYLIFKDNEEEENNSNKNHLPNKSSSVSTLTFDGDKSLTNDAYKIYLVKKYGIEKNEALGKFIVSDKLFSSIEEALSYASGIDERSTASQSEKISTQNSVTQKKMDESDDANSYAESNLATVSIHTEAINSKDEAKSASSFTDKESEEKKSETNLIRNRLIIGSVLLLVGGAYYVNKSSEDPIITALIEKNRIAVFECNEKNIKSSCNVAKQTIKELKSKGYCHGRDNEPRSNHHWHKCDKNSFR